MSITVNGTVRIAAVATTSDPSESSASSATGAAGAVKGRSTGTAQAGLGAALQPPVPLRFPWLSRLSSELEPVAKQKPTFSTLAVTGDNIDQSA